MIFCANSPAKSIAAASSLASCALVMPTELPSVAGFTKTGKRNFLRIARRTLAARFFPLRARDRQEIADRQLGLQEQALLHVLVHADGGAQHARADVGQPGEIEQALHGAVFAKRAVQHGKHHIHAQRIRARIVRGNERGDVGIGGEHHAFARAQHFTQSAEAGSILCAAVPASQRPSLAMPMGTASYFSGSSARDHGRRRDQRDFVLAGAPAEQNADAQLLFFCGHKCDALCSAGFSL